MWTKARAHWGRSLGVLAVGVIGIIAFYRAVAPHDPPQGWLVWRYLAVGAQAALFALGSLCGGHALLSLIPVRLPVRERLVMSFALGVLSWALLTVVLGLLGLLGTVAFLGIPLVGILLGGLRLRREVARLFRLRAVLRPQRERLTDRLRRLFGVVCVFLIWVPLLTPANVTYDAMWYHLPLAEQYAAAGGLFRLEEGWFSGTMPHLSTYLYTWAFLSPSSKLFDSIVLAAHLEFVIFLATLAFVPVLVDVLLPRPRLVASWPLLFLFPGVFLYDSALGCGADHVLAFWTIPFFLSLRRFWRRPNIGNAVLFGATTGAAALTKYQAVIFLIGPAVVVFLRLVWSMARLRWSDAGAMFLAAMSALVVSSPHWLLNTMWHHNPIYPHLSSVFPSVPLVEGVDTTVAEKAWIPKGTPFEKVKETLLATAQFGFESHDWITFHQERPVFGSLFLVAVGFLPFLQRRRAVGALMALTWSAVPIWYWTHHQDRYLQAIVPLAAVAVGVALVGIWRRYGLARPAVAALAGFQVLHASDIWTLPAHATLSSAPVHSVVDLIASNKRSAPEELVDRHFAISRAQKVLPRTAKVLVHDVHIHLGLGRVAVRDHTSRQGAINWALLGSTRAAADQMENMGVTHLYWPGTPTAWSSIGDDLVFYRFAQRTGVHATPLGDGSWVTPIEKELVQSETTTVLVIDCATSRMTPLELNRRWEPLYFTPCASPVVPDDLDAQIAASEVVVIDSRKHPTPPARLPAEFALLFDRYGFKVWGRR
jgi:hypothetical protein